MDILDRFNASKQYYSCAHTADFLFGYINEFYLLPDLAVTHVELYDDTLIFDYQQDPDKLIKFQSLMTDLGICQSWLVCAYYRFNVSTLVFILSTTEIRTFTIDMALGGDTARFSMGSR